MILVKNMQENTWYKQDFTALKNEIFIYILEKNKLSFNFLRLNINSLKIDKDFYGNVDDEEFFFLTEVIDLELLNKLNIILKNQIFI